MPRRAAYAFPLGRQMRCALGGPPIAAGLARSAPGIGLTRPPVELVLVVASATAGVRGSTTEPQPTNGSRLSPGRQCYSNAQVESGAAMRITAIRETVAPISSAIANAYIDFSKMTASVVAIHTDLVRDGKPVIGFGFNSNGRYAVQGLLRERFIPRLLEAAPDSLSDEAGLFDPAKAWDTMMRNEKPGGHGERSVAVGVLDMALWDLRAKAEGVPLWRLLADRYRNGDGDPRAWVYAAGGYYSPGKGIEALQDEIRHYRDLGYACVKIKIGGVPLADDLRRIEAVLAVVGPGDK